MASDLISGRHLGIIQINTVYILSLVIIIRRVYSQIPYVLLYY